MVFGERSALVGFCIRLHNFCVDARLQLGDEIRTGNGVIEVVPSVQLMAPIENSNGIPVLQLIGECRCQTFGQKSRPIVKADYSRRLDLEDTVKEKSLVRPYRLRG